MVISNNGRVLQIYISPGTYTLDELAEEITGVFSEIFAMPDISESIVVPGSNINLAFTYEWKYDKKNNIFIITGLSYRDRNIGIYFTTLHIYNIPTTIIIEPPGGYVKKFTKLNNSIQRLIRSKDAKSADSILGLKSKNNNLLCMLLCFF